MRNKVSTCTSQEASENYHHCPSLKLAMIEWYYLMLYCKNIV
ncbi:unnamed protein product [Musa textilis]